jgi:Leucine-rich repeat (LRR) protein
MHSSCTIIRLCRSYSSHSSHSSLFILSITFIFTDSFHFRLRSPECFNLDKRNLDVCPLIKGENKLRLLNYQNNKISVITNLENLSDLIFLDFYNNNLKSLGGSLSWVPGMIGPWIFRFLIFQFFCLFSCFFSLHIFL